MRALALSLLATALPAQDAAIVPDPPIPEGHSHYGATFDEGPRQAARLMDGMNSAVSFPVTTASPDGQAFFDQGVVQLHGFWYLEAERSFRQVAAIDPDCAMAYWGMAMANVDNERRAHGFAREAFVRRDRAGDLERMHIEALARFHAADAADAGTTDYTPPEPRSDADVRRRRRYVEDLEAALARFPDHVETKAFLANQLWLDQDAGIATPSRQANDALLQQVFAAVPLHPAHHYRVHLWDSRATAERATGSAALLGHTAPGIAHMWHMGGHIWAQLDRHGDAAWQQEASARVDHAQMMRDRVMPDQIHNYAHNNEWLCRSLRHVGRVTEAIDLAKNMVELPRHPVWNDPAQGRNSANYGPRRLLETLETWECWDEALALADTMYLDTSSIEPAEDLRWSSRRLVLLARARFARGERDELAALHARATALLDDARHRRAAAIDTAEAAALASGAGADAVDEAVAAAARGPTRSVREVHDAERQVDGLLQWLDAAGDDARRREALARLETAGHDRGHLARLWLAVGDGAKARELATTAAREAGRAAPLANLVHVLWECGARDEARERFETLRAFSARFELAREPFRRLETMCAELGLPADWRAEDVPAPDVGVRPDLDTLGPFRWSPSPAPGFALPDRDRAIVRLADRAGRPILVVLFLGFGCVHCVEQLQALAPLTEAFRAAGIDVVAIGTDTVAELAASEAGATPTERYPFTILADPDLDTFRAWRAYDDFERTPLHGTFLVDAAGLVRWQDVGYEPFTDLAFLLRESRRLLALPTAAD
ncbi:MAG: redoxin domain-containing protein [Planctomycetes bacterium]|nr:redoxin domain-containing protein [Planctomycetota bacterium]